MIGAFRYSAANASVQDGIGKLLSESVWDRLVRASNISDRLSVLADGAYADAVSGEAATLAALEKRIRRQQALSFLLPLPFLRGRPKALVEWMLVRFELENLLKLVRSIHHGRPQDRTESALLVLEELSELNWNSIAGAASISGLAERLGRTPAGELYAGSLERAEGEYQRRNSVFVLETALTVDYYRELRRRMDRLVGSDRKYAALIVETMVDAKNLLWTLRCRIHFRFGPETTLGSTLPRSDRVTASILQRAATGAAVEEVAKAAWGESLPDMDRIRNRPDKDALQALEVILARHLHDVCRKVLTRHPLQLGTILAYLALRGLEVRDLVAVLEAGAYRWSEKKIRSTLAGPGRRP